MTRERYGLIIAEYLNNCGRKRLSELKTQMVLMEKLASLAKMVISSDFTCNKKRTRTLRQGIKKMSPIFQSPFGLPINEKLKCTGFIPRRCKVLSSKKRPIFLSLRNIDKNAANVNIIVKTGDDLRQDILTLQSKYNHIFLFFTLIIIAVLKIVDLLWKNNGLDLHLSPYDVVSTSHGVGMIQTVANSITLAKIARSSGNGVFSGAMKTFSSDVLLKYLKKMNPTGADKFFLVT